MEQNFRKQTTELQTVFPFKGKGLVNDRLRLDVSGLAANTEYVLSYDTTTGTFAWSTPDEVSGIDTIYTADGTISENRTITLDSETTFQIEGLGDSNIYIWTTATLNPSQFSELDITAVSADLYHEEGDEINLNIRSQVRADVNGVRLSQEYTNTDYSRVIYLAFGEDTEGFQFSSTLTGTEGTNADNNFSISLQNVEDSDTAEFTLSTGSNGGDLNLSLTDSSEDFTGAIDFGSGSSGFAVSSTIGDYVATFDLPSATGQEIELRIQNNDTSEYSSLELYPEAESGALITVTDDTIQGNLEINTASSSLTWNDGAGTVATLILGNSEGTAAYLAYSDNTYSHTLYLGEEEFAQLDNTFIARKSGNLTGTGGTDVTFTLPGATIYNFNATVYIYCSVAGNGIGLTTNEAFVGWYGVGVNNLDSSPALIGTAQALGTAQADAGMADAAVTFTVGTDPDVLNVHIEGPTTAGTTSEFTIVVALNGI